jgi:hypothetical protein
MKIHAYCDGCNHRHPIEFDPNTPDRQIDDWRYKHSLPGCRVWFDWPGRTVKPSWVSRLMQRWVQRVVPTWVKGIIVPILTAAPLNAEGFSPIAGYLPNANAKLAYASSVDMTFTSVNSLASSSSLLAGASALAVDNTTNLYLDYSLGGFFENNTGSAPTVSTEIDVWLYRAYNDTPTYPDTLAGTDAAKTVTTTAMLNSGLRQVASMVVAATTSQVNPFDAGYLSQYWGSVPHLWSVWVVHNSGQALAATGNKVSYKGQYATIV